METEIIEYNITDAAIAQLADKYMVLKLNGHNDSDGYTKIVEYRKNIKAKRVDVESTRKALKAESLAYGKRIDTEAKRITALLQPIEDHLLSQENIVKMEKERIKAEEQRKVDELNASKVKMVIDSGAVYNGSVYVYGDDVVSNTDIILTDDDSFNLLVSKIVLWKQGEDLRMAEEVRIKKEEEARQAKIAEEQKAKQAEQDKIAEEQAKQAKKLQDAQDKIDKEKRDLAEKKRIEEATKKAKIAAEKKAAEDKKNAALKVVEDKKNAALKVVEDKKNAALKVVEDKKKAAQKAADIIVKHDAEIAAEKKKAIEDEKRHKIELEEAKKKAAIDAKIATEKKEKEKLAAEKKAKAESEKKARLLPDKEKLVLFANVLKEMQRPNVESEEAKVILGHANSDLKALHIYLKDSAEKL